MSLDEFIQKRGTTASDVQTNKLHFVTFASKSARAFLELNVKMWHGDAPYGDAALQLKTYQKRVGSGSVNCLLLAGLLSFSGCSDEHNIKNRVNIAGVSLKTGVTDSGGNESFTDDHDGSNLNVYVSDENYKSLPEVNILFADGSNFGLFLLDHDGYEPLLYPSDQVNYDSLQLQSNDDNINYNFSLTPAPLQFNHFDKNDPNYEGAENSFRWSENWPDIGCYEKEELGIVMKPGGYLVKKGSSYLTAGVSDIFIDDLAETLKDKVEDDEVIVMHSFIPSKYGIYGLTSIASLEIMKGSCNNYQEENNQENLNDDYQCQDTVFCDHFNDSLDKWNVQGSAKIDNGWLKMEGANIINKTEIYFPQCNSAEIEYQARVEGNYGLYLGNEMALYADGDNSNLQFVCGSEGKNMNISLQDDHTVKVQLGSFLNVNGNSIPCYNLPSYVNFSAGSVSTLELDYVEVRCK